MRRKTFAWLAGLVFYTNPCPGAQRNNAGDCSCLPPWIRVKLDTKPEFLKFYTFMEPRNRSRQAENRFLGPLKGLQIRARCPIYCSPFFQEKPLPCWSSWPVFRPLSSHWMRSLKPRTGRWYLRRLQERNKAKGEFSFHFEVFRFS
jgi:hypothetical protein